MVRDTVGGAESLGLIEDKPQDGVVQLDPAVEVSVNPRFGLAAVGTNRSALLSNYRQIHTDQIKWNRAAHLYTALSSPAPTLAFIRLEALWESTCWSRQSSIARMVCRRVLSSCGLRERVGSMEYGRATGWLGSESRRGRE